MTHISLRSGLALALACLGATSAAADTIYLTAGSALTDVKVTGENYKQIEYKQDSKKKTVKTDKVLRIEFSGKSTLVDQADAAAGDGQIFDAIASLEEYVQNYVETGRRPTFAWEPAYAMFRLVELNREVGDAEHLIKAADQLIAKRPDSRYVPLAFLAKAETQFLTDKAADAKKTLGAFKALIQGQALSGRWRIEEKLASALFDGTLKGKGLRTKLNAISNEAGSAFPIVGSRADVAIGESLVKDKKFGEAEPIFADISKNPAADFGTLAGAYTGLGDCILKRAVAKSGDAKEALLRDAQLAYMRVVVVYKSESRYVPKAMFWAGRCFDESTNEEDKARAQRLYRQVRRDFKGTEWATEASNFIKR
jgi:hypothetical protein